MTIDTEPVMNVTIPSLTSSHGFLALGTTEFGSALFDNLKIMSASVQTDHHNTDFSVNRDGASDKDFNLNLLNDVSDFEA